MKALFAICLFHVNMKFLTIRLIESAQASWKDLKEMYEVKNTLSILYLICIFLDDTNE